MTSINGKWRLVSTTNLEEYWTATKASEEYKENLRKLATARKANPDNYWEEYHVDSKEATLRRSICVKDADKTEGTYKLGVVNEVTTSDGRAMKVSLELVGDNKITIEEEGPGFEIDGFFEVNGDEMQLNLSSQGVNSVQNFTRIA